MKKIFFRRPLFFASFILIFIGLQGVYFKNELKKAYTRGIDVYAKVIDNDGCGSRGNVIKFEYNNRKYLKGITKDYCETRIGTKMLVRYDEKSDTLLFLGENFEEEINISYLILLTGIIIAIIGLKGNKKLKKI